jgi:hypothetical protein
MLGLDFEIGVLVVLALEIYLDRAFAFSLDDERAFLGIFDIGAGDRVSRRYTHGMLLGLATIHAGTMPPLLYNYSRHRMLSMTGVIPGHALDSSLFFRESP